ncbi:hypothetical protein Q9966_012645 [Columba livia]|nr:hypothetical protein Q9966_012645 [Columba livia]
MKLLHSKKDSIVLHCRGPGYTLEYNSSAAMRLCEGRSTKKMFLQWECTDLLLDDQDTSYLVQQRLQEVADTVGEAQQRNRDGQIDRVNETFMMMERYEVP